MAIYGVCNLFQESHPVHHNWMNSRDNIESSFRTDLPCSRSHYSGQISCLPCLASPFLPGTHCCFPVFHLVFPYHPIFRFIKINKQLWIYVIITLNAICSHCFYSWRFKPPYIISFLLSFFLFFYCCRYLVVTLSILCRYLVGLCFAVNQYFKFSPIWGITCA